MFNTSSFYFIKTYSHFSEFSGRVPNLSKEQFPLIELNKNGLIKANEF